MNNLMDEWNKERQKNYTDARNDFIKAMHSISKLDQDQKRQLFAEFANAEAVLAFYNALRQYFG